MMQTKAVHITEKKMEAHGTGDDGPSEELEMRTHQSR